MTPPEREIRFTVHLPPVTKKNHQEIFINSRTGKPFVTPSRQYKDYEEAAVWYVPRRGARMKGRYNVKCLFYVDTRRRCDLTNMLEAIDDVIVKAGLLADDNYNIIAGHDGSRVIYDPEGEPRTEVTITPMTEE